MIPCHGYGVLIFIITALGFLNVPFLSPSHSALELQRSETTEGCALSFLLLCYRYYYFCFC
jgi:hypothetical protein